MTRITTNTPRAGERAEQTAARSDRVRKDVAMRNGAALKLPTNGLAGAKVNEDGDAV